MTKVLADDLTNNQVSSLVQFMESASDGKLARRGNKIEISGLTNKKVKFLLRKFLHTNHLSEYGVLDTAGTFEIIRNKPEAKKTEIPVTLKHPVPYGPQLPYLSGVLKPSLRVEWQGRPPKKKTRYKKWR